MIKKQMVQLLSSFANEFFMTQIISEPTHYQGNTLDLIFTNNRDLIYNCEYVSPLRSVSHHKLVEVATKLDVQIEAASSPQKKICSETIDSPFTTLNFYSDEVDWLSIEEDLSNIDWVLEFKNLDVNSTHKKFIDICYEVASKYVPFKKRYS